MQRGQTRPTGQIHLTNENAALDTDWTTAAGTESYPGKLLFSSLLFSSLLFSSLLFSATVFMYIKYFSCLLSLAFTDFAMAALLSYKNLEISVNQSFELTGRENDIAVPSSLNVSSKVVSVVVSNPSTQNLNSPIKITLRHLQVIQLLLVFSLRFFLLPLSYLFRNVLMNK